MKNEKKAFTLIEIMVVVALIGIIALGISKLDFNKLSDKQKSDGFFYKIKTNIETIRNNALIGKAIKLPDNSTLVPKKWKIDFNNYGKGIIVNNYYDGINYVEYSKIIPNKFYEIIISNDSLEITETGTLLIEGGNLSLTGMTTSNKTLEIKVKYKNLEKDFSINTISGVIEEK